MLKDFFFGKKAEAPPPTETPPAEPKQPEPSTEKPVAAKKIEVDPEAERERQLLDRDIPRHDRIDVSRISLYEPSPTTMPVRKVETFVYDQSTCERNKGSYCCNNGQIAFIDKQGTP